VIQGICDLERICDLEHFCCSNYLARFGLFSVIQITAASGASGYHGFRAMRVPSFCSIIFAINILYLPESAELFIAELLSEGRIIAD
jgi:hypothetical protein